MEQATRLVRLLAASVGLPHRHSNDRTRAGFAPHEAIDTTNEMKVLGLDAQATDQLLAKGRNSTQKLFTGNCFVCMLSIVGVSGPHLVPLLSSTCDDTLGPYFPPPFVERSGSVDLFSPKPGLTVGPQGAPVILLVNLLDIDGNLADSALLETWQANSRGFFRVPGSEEALASDPFFEGYGRAYSPSGEFRVRTVMPGPIQGSPGVRAPSIGLTIFSDGIARITTLVFFEGMPENDADPVLSALPSEVRPRLLAKRRGSSAEGDVYSIDIKMRGEGETPFFDDVR